MPSRLSYIEDTYQALKSKVGADKAAEILTQPFGYKALKGYQDLRLMPVEAADNLIARAALEAKP